jgi:hypothetical protein
MTKIERARDKEEAAKEVEIAKGLDAWRREIVSFKVFGIAALKEYQISGRIKRMQNNWRHNYHYELPRAKLVDIAVEECTNLNKEWSKDGKYFDSKEEWFDAIMSDDYDSILKAKKKK